jgi:hypothetical protein
VSAWANPMPFWQQLFGQLAVVAFTTIRHYWTYPRVRDVLMTRLFVDETVPDLADLERTSSLFLLSDDYRVFNYQGPKVADVIEVGCIHCVPAGPLPEVCSLQTGKSFFFVLERHTAKTSNFGVCTSWKVWTIYCKIRFCNFFGCKM